MTVPPQALRGGELEDVLDRIRRTTPAAPPARTARQPLHTVYVPADRFDAGTVASFGREAERLLEEHAPDPPAVASAFDIEPSVAAAVRERVAARLADEPVEDVRIDLEDGYGVRPDGEEDGHAIEAARAVVTARRAGGFARSFGVRVKPFADGLERRGVRSLDLFVSEFVMQDGGVPDGFVVTFPKVVAVEHVALFVEVLERLEATLGLPNGTLRFEVQVETPRSVVDADGRLAASGILRASGGRLSSMHFGVFDYTSSLGLMPWEQRLDHPANDAARYLTQVALAGTGVGWSDGSTNVVPASERTEDVRAAWRIHADHVRHSLAAGFSQGWDLHPSHLVSRYAAVYGWLLPHLNDAVARVRAWRSDAPATGVLDEPATISSLLRYLRFVVSSGAAEETEILGRTGLDHDELAGAPS